VDIGGAGDYVAKVDARIRRVKEIYRTVKAGLPWMLPRSLVPELVAYVVSCMSIRRTTTLSENVCPRVLFTGIPVDFKRELCMASGDYVEAYEGTDNTSRMRSSACIALYPMANSTGAWVLWKISNQSKVRRTNYVKLVTNESIINAINQIAVNEEQQVMLPSAETQEDARGDTQEQAQEDIQPEIKPEIQPEIQPGTQEETEEDAAPEEIEEAVNAEDENEEELTPQDVTRTRSGRAVVRPRRFMGVTKVANEDWKMKANEKVING
jgi:hypothetical protein